MPTIIVTNPLRALQLENQQLRRELALLRQRLADVGGNRELATSGEPARAATATPVRSAPAVAPPIRPAPSTARTTVRPVAAGPAPRPMIQLVATDAPVPTAPRPSRMEAPAVAVSRPSRAEPEALDDAAARFQLLELD